MKLGINLIWIWIFLQSKEWLKDLAVSIHTLSQNLHVTLQKPELQLRKRELLHIQISHERLISDDKHGPYGPCEEND